MYIFKSEKKQDVKLFNKNEVANVIGIHPVTLRNILNGKQKCSKLVAYCITKFLNREAEISFYFERVE